MAFEVTSAGRLLGSVTTIGDNLIVRGPDGSPLGQYGCLAAAVARLLRGAP